MAVSPVPIARWTATSEAGDQQGMNAEVCGAVEFGRSSDPAFQHPVARLGGAGWLEAQVPTGFGAGDLTLSVWVNAAARPTTVLGDIVAWFDPATRRGITLGFEHGSPCGSHGNDRTAWFGTDSGSAPRLTDHGRPGGPDTVMVCSLAAFEGSLYAATWEQGAAPKGRVYRLDGTTWVDCGSPWDANAVTRLAVHNGALYAGTSRLRGGGSGLEDSANQNPGGRILRYEGDGRWADEGQLAGADSVAALVPYAGDLYAAPMYSEGLFRLDAPGTWTWCGTPGRRLLALGVHAGSLYGAGNDHAQVDSAIALTKAGIVVPARSSTGGGGVFRYDGGEQWTSRGLQPDTTQLYSIETYGGRMYIGTWPTGQVFRANDPGGDAMPTWEPVGRLGDETEIMNLQAYNGKLYGGTLPHAEIQRYDADGSWTPIATLDQTPDVRYRRAASMVLFGGELYVGTLPSARVHSVSAGSVASHDASLAAGWHMLTGVRQDGRATLFVDGVQVATGPSVAGIGGSAAPDSRFPLVLGGGPRTALEGELADVAVWDRALNAEEIRALNAQGLEAPAPGGLPT